MMHWAEPYIGLPWRANAAPPEHARPGDAMAGWAFDCRSFFLWVQRWHFGRIIALPDADAGNLLAVTRGFRDGLVPEALPAGWRPVDWPGEGDAVVMRRGVNADHIGTWVAIDGGGVLHCLERTGVGFHGRAALAAQGLFVAGFYRPEIGGEACAA